MNHHEIRRKLEKQGLKVEHGSKHLVVRHPYSGEVVTRLSMGAKAKGSIHKIRRQLKAKGFAL